jgi:hypothetical protein
MDRTHLLLWCRRKTNNPKLEDEKDFSLVLDELTDLLGRAGVVSESIDSLNQSFNGEVYKDVMLLLSPYRKAKFI